MIINFIKGIYIYIYTYTVTLMKTNIYLDVNKLYSQEYKWQSSQAYHSVLDCSVQVTIFNLATGYLVSQLYLPIINTKFFFPYIASQSTRDLSYIQCLGTLDYYMNYKIYPYNKLFINTNFYSEIRCCHFKYSSASGGS